MDFSMSSLVCWMSSALVLLCFDLSCVSANDRFCGARLFRQLTVRQLLFCQLKAAKWIARRRRYGMASIAPDTVVRLG